MTNASIEKELRIQTPDSVGMAGKLTSYISGTGTNIKSMWGGSWEHKGMFSFVTEDNEKVKNALSGSEFSDYSESDVLVVWVPDKKGTCSEVASKIGKAGININYFYTTIFDNKPAVILSTDDNQKAYGLFQ